MGYLVVRELGSEHQIPLAEEEVSIGRSRQNRIKLLTEQASRRHCRVLKMPTGRYKIEDTNSSNGTYINGLRVDAKELAEGDQVSIGQATITYHEGEPGRAVPGVPEGGTAPIPIQDRNVQILLNTIINAANLEDPDTFLRTAIDNITEIANAERGILFMKQTSPPAQGPGAQQAPTGDLYVRVARDDRRKDITELVGMSRSIPQQVFETRKAIYLLDTEQEKESVQSQSVSIYHLRTVMCAPMRVGEKLLGVLYVDSHAKTREYTGTDLALFEAVTNYLALTIENVRAAQDLKRREEEKRKSLEAENQMLRAALERRRHVIGNSAPMKAVYETIRKVAPTDATVLILGESGTGKEVMAHVLHDLSPRSQQPFVVIDCAAIPETLLESELFGYDRGAFTGATAPKPGKFELAQGGTLFLDEIGELPLSLQVKLLRAIEARTVTRVGGTEPIKIDARIVTATNRNLDEAVAQNKFRQDLYFRLKVVSLKLPPLRERGDDIFLLADFLLQDANSNNSRTVKGLSEEAKHAIQAHKWDGNIRELKHRIEQAVILTNNEYVSTEDLNLSGQTGMFRSLEIARDIFEKGYIDKALAKNSYNVTHTAKAIGISRQHLQNLIKKHGITKYTDTGE